MNRVEIEGLIAGLLSADHPQPIDPKAVYRTRAVPLFTKAAVALRAQQERIDALEAALKPFAEACDACIGPLECGTNNTWEHSVGMSVEVQHYRDARATLPGEKP